MANHFLKSITESLDKAEQVLTNKTNLDEAKKKKIKKIKTAILPDYAAGIDQFNKMNSCIAPKEPETALEDTADNAITDSSIDNSAGDIAEECNKSDKGCNLLEKKRRNRTKNKNKTKRYYLKPQNIFCATKNELLQAIANSGGNTTIYSLKNLENNEEIQKLQPTDIIYTYVNGELFDKNGIKVYDYNLYIGHEEDRKRVATTQQQNSKGETEVKPSLNGKQEYEDRILAEGIFGIGKKKCACKAHPELAPTDMETNWIFDAYGETDLFRKIACLRKNGHCSTEDQLEIKKAIRTISSELKVDEDKATSLLLNAQQLYYKCNGIQEAFDSFVEEEDEDELSDDFNYLDCDFTSYNANNEVIDEDGNVMDQECCICGEHFNGYGNNPQPYCEDGRCCDACNSKFVIPARLAIYLKNK